MTFNEDLSIASLFLKGLTQGQAYHVTGTVDGEDFFRFSESEFTAETSGLVVLPVNVAFRPYGVLLKVVEGPIPAQDP